MIAQDYMRLQRTDLMQGFDSPAEHPVGVKTPEDCQRGSLFAVWEWDQNQKRKNDAFVRRVPTRPPEYWIDVNKRSGYREGFLAFLEREFGVPSDSVGSHLHVDHMLNAAFARNHGLGYVRLALLGRDSNTSYGRLLEKHFSNAKAHSKQMYLLDYPIMMKMLDISAPASKEDYVERKREIAMTFAANGLRLPLDRILEGLDGTFKLWSVLK